MIQGLMNNALASLHRAITSGDGDAPESTPITADHMRRWNKLIQFAKDKGYAGKEELDHNPELRKKVFDEYNNANPDDTLSIDMVKPIQNEIQTYKKKAIENIKNGKGEYKGNIDGFMKGISQVDGLFGQKTSQWSFPTAYIEEKGKKTAVGYAPKVDIDSLRKGVASGMTPLL